MKFIYLAIFLLIGCASKPEPKIIVDDPHATSDAQGPQIYFQGVKQLVAGDYVRALETFDKFLEAQPVSPYTQVTIFNSARALEGLQKWHEASTKLRAVAQATSKAPRLQALALYELSFPYEAVGDDPATVATLTDALARASYLPDQIASAELPARLASAYARVGNLEQAMFYYTKAESGIARLRHKSREEKSPEWLARTLFLMGRVSLKEISWDEFESALRPVERAQFYLLQAIELEDQKWSEEALREIQRVYDQIVAVLRTPPSSTGDDAVLTARENQKRQWELAELTLGAVRKLRAAKPPVKQSQSTHIATLFSYMTTVEKRLTQIVNQPLIGEGLTKEAQDRKSRVRGKVVSPNDILEKQYTKKTTPSSTPAETPAADKSESDPNL